MCRPLARSSRRSPGPSGHPSTCPAPWLRWRPSSRSVGSGSTSRGWAAKAADRWTSTTSWRRASEASPRGVTGMEPAVRELASYREEFEVVRRKSYLISASLGPVGDRSRRYLDDYVRAWASKGAPNHVWFEDIFPAMARLKRSFAELGKCG